METMDFYLIYVKTFDMTFSKVCDCYQTRIMTALLSDVADTLATSSTGLITKINK